MSAQSHFDKYEALAQQLGVPALCRLIPFGKARILDAYGKDRHLNSIALSRWDVLDYAIRALAVRAGCKSWSLCETVCVAKHVALYHVAGLPRPTAE